MSANTLYKQENIIANKKRILASSILMAAAFLFFSAGAVLICLLFPRTLKTLQIFLLSIDLVFGTCLIVFLLTAHLLPSLARKKFFASFNGEPVESKCGKVKTFRQRTLFRCLPCLLVSFETSGQLEEVYYDLDSGPLPFKEGDEVQFVYQGRFLVGYDAVAEKSLD